MFLGGFYETETGENVNRNIKKNLGLQTAYQILSAFAPLVTAPYLARRLGASQLGVFSYTTSIVSYFTLFAMLGTVNYGTRSIAAAREDRQKRSEIFTSIFTLQICISLLTIVAYLIYLTFFCKSNYIIAWLQGIAVINCILDINWLYFGIEEFKITVTRNFVVKILTIGLILILVKSQTDLWKYTVIMLTGTLASNFFLFIHLPRYVKFTRVSAAEIIKHIKPNLILFVPVLAMTVYHTMDKTMLGLMSTYEQGGFYYNSDKIVQIPLLIVNGIGTVMLPRMTALLAEGNRKGADELFYTTLDGVSVVCIAIGCGIAATSREFIPLFFGVGYESCIRITIVFTPILLFKGVSTIVRTQYLIPMKMEKDFTKSVIGGAIVNVVLNYFLIPPYGALGAAIATVVAEAVACVFQLYSLRNRDIGLCSLSIRAGVYLVFGITMIGLVKMVSFIPVGSVIKLLMAILVGACYYSCACLVFWKKTNNPFCRMIEGSRRGKQN